MAKYHKLIKIVLIDFDRCVEKIDFSNVKGVKVVSSKFGWETVIRPIFKPCCMIYFHREREREENYINSLVC